MWIWVHLFKFDRLIIDFLFFPVRFFLASIYLLKVNKRNQNKAWNMFKVNNNDTGKTQLANCWCPYCYLWTHFTPCSSVSIVNFEQVNADWVNIDHTFHWAVWLSVKTIQFTANPKIGLYQNSDRIKIYRIFIWKIFLHFWPANWVLAIAHISAIKEFKIINSVEKSL